MKWIKCDLLTLGLVVCVFIVSYGLYFGLTFQPAVTIPGLRGVQGTQGVQGDKGNIGMTGLRGGKGDTGTIGLQGIPGEKGDTGLQGLQGEKGDTWYNDLPKLYKQTSPAVVWIGAEYSDAEFLASDWRDIYRKRGENIPITVKWQGTGFFVTSNLIATAGHVVENTESFIVQFQDGHHAYADFIHMENINRCDVGFIKLRDNRRHSFYFNLDTRVEIGESLIIIGYPWGLNNGMALTQGVVSLSNREELFFGIKLVMHVDAASYPGNSGSPVINMDGEVVGILIGGRYGCDNWSIVTRAKLVELAMQKALAEIGLRETK